MTDAAQEITGTAPVDEVAADALLAFLGSSPSPYHAVQTAAGLLQAAGFTAIDLGDRWPVGPGRWFVRSGGALVAVAEPPGAHASTAFRLVAAHTDSPTLRVKPNADIGAAGWQQVGVDVYGGALLNTWLDRDLGVAGRLALRDGSVHLVRVDTPLLRVPQLAIHLDREVNTAGLKLDRQRHLVPVSGLGAPRPGALRAVVAEAAGVRADDVLAHDLALFDLTPPARLGAAGEFVSSARLDDQFCSWAAVTAVAGLVGDGADAAVGDVAVGDVAHRVVVALFDHEEVGSVSTTGAGGTLLPDVLERVVAAAGGGREEVHRALAGSLLVSADMAHAVHPNYPERAEPAHAPLPNGGPVVKVNAAARYATEAGGYAAFVAACERVGVPHQVYVHRSNLPCGSTIGPILAARLGVATVDVGAAQLSMHSARELAGAADAGQLVAALRSVLAGRPRLACPGADPPGHTRLTPPGVPGRRSTRAHQEQKPDDHRRPHPLAARCGERRFTRPGPAHGPRLATRWSVVVPLRSAFVARDRIVVPGLAKPVKVKATCCRSAPRCRSCPLVVARLLKLPDGLSEKKLKKAVRAARRH